ncbi:hypothetical protein [Methyloversatilis sp.]|uniref:hypothetical protein n=1 Tax=Methyloversatilis sp. TaxID=2569862 RepID=UPI003F72446D
MPISRWILFALLAVTLGGCATSPPRPPAPTTDEIVQMSKDGLTPAEIIQRIDESGGLYALKASELANLREQGVSDEVIDHMQLTLIEATRAREAMRERERMWMFGYPGYPGYPWGYWRRPFY